MPDYALGRLYAQDVRDASFPMRLQLDPLRQQYFPKGLAAGTRHYRPGKVLDQGKTGTCFPPGTLILMADGSEKPIEQVLPGERVWTHKHRSQMVRASMARHYVGWLVHLRARSLYTELTCTPEHPLYMSEISLVDSRRLVAVAGGDTERAGHARMVYEAPDFRRASSARLHVRHGTGDALVLSRGNTPVVYNVGSQLDILSLLPFGTTTNHDNTTVRVYGGRANRTLPRLLTLTEEVAWCLGIYLAEGRAQILGGSSLAVFGGHEEDMARKYARIIEQAFGIAAHVARRPSGVWNVNSNSTTLAALLCSLGGTGCCDKRLNPVVFSWDAPLLEALWNGFRDGDGHQRLSPSSGMMRTVLTTVSPQLARDFFRIALRLGWAPSLMQTKPQISHGVKSRRHRYDVTVYEGSRFNQGDSQTLPRAVKNKTEGLYDGLVFNIEVEEDRSYVANGFIVHNCVAHGWSSKMHAAPIMQLLPVSPFDLYRKIVLVDEWASNDSEATGPDSWLQSGTSVRAGAKVLQGMGYLQNYLWAESVEDVRAWHLAGFGGCVLGVNWTANMFQTDPDGFVNYTGNVQGGHCVTSTGWSDTVRHHGVKVRALRCQNSWGVEFGTNGRFWISEDDLAKLLADEGECAAPTEIRVTV